MKKTFKAQLNARDSQCADIWTDEQYGIMVWGAIHVDFFEDLVDGDTFEDLGKGQEVEFELVVKCDDEKTG